jgi:hypothetical protein
MLLANPNSLANINPQLLSSMFPSAVHVKTHYNAESSPKCTISFMPPK